MRATVEWQAMLRDEVERLPEMETDSLEGDVHSWSPRASSVT